MIFSDLGEQYYDWLHKIVCGESQPSGKEPSENAMHQPLGGV